MLSLGSVSDSQPGAPLVKNRSSTDAIHKSHAGAPAASSLRSQTPQA